MVALKFFRRGPNYEGAVQRERYILDTFHEPQHNIVSCYAYLTYRGLHCLVLELLDVNIRQVKSIDIYLAFCMCVTFRLFSKTTGMAFPPGQPSNLQRIF